MSAVCCPHQRPLTERLKLTLMTVAKYQLVESLDAQSHPSYVFIVRNI